MRRSRPLHFLLLLIFLFTGCELFPGSGESVLLRTDREFYNIDQNTVISLTVTNRLDDTIYYICTGQVYLEELKKGEVIDFWQVHGFEECLGRGPIEPGARHLFRIPINFAYLQTDRRMPRLDETVSYRMRADLFHDTNFRVPVNPSMVLSNEFSLIPAN